jgi:hypothetical protein
VSLDHISEGHSTNTRRGEGLRVTKPAWRDGWLWFYALALLATIVAGVIAGTGGRDALVNPPPISEQIEDQKHEVLQGPRGRHVVVDERIRFHGGEADPWILVTEDGNSHDDFDQAARDEKGKPPPSDDLRVYDVQDGRLKLKLHFQPRAVNGHAVAWREIAGETPALATDYDKDGTQEVIAGYEIPAEATAAVVPFAVAWGERGYRLVPLTPRPPGLSHRALDRQTVRYRKEAYTWRRLTNAVTRGPFKDLTVRGYRVQAFALTEKPAPRLLTGYFTRFPDATRAMELHASQFRASQLAPHACTPDYLACPAPKRIQEVIVPPDRGLDSSLRTAWEKVGSKWSREVRVEERPPGPEAGP